MTDNIDINENVENNENGNGSGGHDKKRIWGLILKIGIPAVILGVVILLFGFPGKGVVQSYRTGFALDTIINISIYDGGDMDTASELLDLCKEYEKQYFSPTDPGSELYRLNHTIWSKSDFVSGSSKVIEISKPIYDTISIASDYYALSDGKYNVAIKPVTELWDFHDASKAVVPVEEYIETALNSVGMPGIDYEVAYNYELKNSGSEQSVYEYALILYGPVTFDLGSVAKGYIADCLKDYAVKHGVTSAVIDLGGNICCVGAKSSSGLLKRKFNIQIDTSFLTNDSKKRTVKVKDGSVVTSGKYQRYFVKDGIHYHHIIDASTGYPVESSLASVSVIGSSSARCDALSTVCFLLGEEKSVSVLAVQGYEAVFIYDDGTVNEHLIK